MEQVDNLSSCHIVPLVLPDLIFSFKSIRCPGKPLSFRRIHHKTAIVNSRTYGPPLFSLLLNGHLCLLYLQASISVVSPQADLPFGLSVWIPIWQANIEVEYMSIIIVPVCACLCDQGLPNHVASHNISWGDKWSLTYGNLILKWLSAPTKYTLCTLCIQVPYSTAKEPLASPSYKKPSPLNTDELWMSNKPWMKEGIWVNCFFAPEGIPI